MSQWYTYSVPYSNILVGSTLRLLILLAIMVTTVGMLWNLFSVLVIIAPMGQVYKVCASCSSFTCRVWLMFSFNIFVDAIHHSDTLLSESTVMAKLPPSLLLLRFWGLVNWKFTLKDKVDNDHGLVACSHLVPLYSTEFLIKIRIMIALSMVDLRGCVDILVK